MTFEEYLKWLDEFWELFGPIPNPPSDSSKYRVFRI